MEDDRKDTERLLSFYYGTGTDHAGRMIEQVWTLEDEFLWMSSDYMPWLFPTSKSDSFPAAPVLTQPVIEEFKQNTHLRKRLERSLERIFRLYGLSMGISIDRCVSISRAADFERKAESWVAPGDHHARMVRVLESLTELGMDKHALALYNCLCDIHTQYSGKIADDTLADWKARVEYVRPQSVYTGLDLVHEQLRKSIEEGAWEVIYTPGSKVTARTRKGKKIPLSTEALTGDDTRKITFHSLTTAEREKLKEKRFFLRIIRFEPHMVFAASYFVSSGKFNVVYTHLPTKFTIAGDREIDLENIIESMSGKVIVCYGDQSSFDLMHSVIDYFNRNRRFKIVILSNGDSFVHSNKQSIVFPLKLGADVESMNAAYPLLERINPDILCIDEVLSFDSLLAALRFSYNVRAIILRVNAPDPVAVVQKLCLFPRFYFDYYSSRQNLADTLGVFIGQRAVDTREGKAKYINEVLPVDDRIRSVIASLGEKLGDLRNIGTRNAGQEITFDNGIDRLIQSGEISFEEAFREYSSRDKFFEKYVHEPEAFMPEIGDADPQA